MQTQTQKILREQEMLCHNCGAITRDDLCNECQIERDEVETVLPQSLPTAVVMNELKAKALTVLMAAKRNDLISWPKDQAFEWFNQQAVERNVAPNLRNNFVNATMSLYLQSLG